MTGVKSQTTEFEGPIISEDGTITFLCIRHDTFMQRYVDAALTFDGEIHPQYLEAEWPESDPLQFTFTADYLAGHLDKKVSTFMAEQ